MKLAKRILADNTLPSGSLNMDKFMAVLLRHCNQLDKLTGGLSPAMIMMGRRLCDNMPFVSRLDKFPSKLVSGTWRDAWRLREETNGISLCCGKRRAHAADPWS